MMNAHSLNRPSGFWLVFAALAAVSLPLHLGLASADVSWLISMCERMLDGETAYVDIFETTPPVPTLLYMPGVVISRLLPLSAETGVLMTTYLAVIVALALSARILPPTISAIGSSRWLIIFPAAFFLFVLASGSFAQREYFAAAFVLPIIAVFIAHEENGDWPSFQMRMAAALLAGLSIAIKPPVFAAPGMLLGLYFVVTTRNFRGLYSSGLIAGGVIGVAITALSLAIFPEYLGGVTTLMRDVYVPLRENIWVAFNGAFIGFIAVMVGGAVFQAQKKAPNTVNFMLIAAIGYAVIFVLQGKYFPYHILPASFLAFIGFWVLSARRLSQVFEETGRNLPLIFVYAGIFGLVSILIYRGFALDARHSVPEDMQWAENLENPTAMAISPYISLGFPLSRPVDAVWVDRIHSQWVSNYTRLALQRQDDPSSAFAQRMRDYYERDLERTRNVIRQQRPDLIFQAVAEPVSWLTEALLEDDPQLLDDYVVVLEGGTLRILQRRDTLSENTRN